MKAFSMLLKLKDSDTFEWRAEHQEAFTQIKVSLTTPPVLVPSRQGRPLQLYISVAEESIGCLLAQDNDDRREQAIFYLSRNSTHQRLITPLSRNSILPYFSLHSNLDITCSRQSLKSSPRLMAESASGRWPFLNSACNMYPRKLSNVKLWSIFWPNTLPRMSLGAEYEALVISLGVLHDLRATCVLVLGDSELVINQLNGTFRCMSCTLAPYHMVASYLAESFDGVTFKHISRVHNTDTDELAQIASGAQFIEAN
ncbi:unnamed protein product [Malus baccata var. baccata]